MKIYMVYDPARVAEPTGRAHWPLGANVDVVVVADTVSKDLNDLKVSLTPSGLSQPEPSQTLLHRDPGFTHPNTTQHMGTTPSPPRSTETPRYTSHLMHPNVIQLMGTTWSPLRSTQLYATHSSCPQTSVLPKQDPMAMLRCACTGPWHSHSSLHTHIARHLWLTPPCWP